MNYYVYLLKITIDGYQNLFKIGYSYNIKYRLTKLLEGAKSDVTKIQCIGFIQVASKHEAKNYEQQLHTKYREYKATKLIWLTNGNTELFTIPAAELIGQNPRVSKKLFVKSKPTASIKRIKSTNGITLNQLLSSVQAKQTRRDQFKTWL